MLEDFHYKIPSPIVQAIEDAILLGNIRELDGILDLVKDEALFPQDLRYGIEALMYFRMHYGKGGDLEPKSEADKQKLAQTETLWGRELIESMGHYPDLTEMKYA